MKSLVVSLMVAMVALVALIFISQSSPVDAFTIYRIGSDADWLMSSAAGEDYDDDDSDYDDEGEADVAAFDQDSLDDAEVVVDEDEVLPAWRGVPAEGVELAKEEVVESFTSFVIDLDEPDTPPTDPGDLKPEQFGPPTFYLANHGMLHRETKHMCVLCLNMCACACACCVCCVLCAMVGLRGWRIQKWRTT